MYVNLILFVHVVEDPMRTNDHDQLVPVPALNRMGNTRRALLTRYACMYKKIVRLQHRALQI